MGHLGLAPWCDLVGSSLCGGAHQPSPRLSPLQHSPPHPPPPSLKPPTPSVQCTACPPPPPTDPIHHLITVLTVQGRGGGGGKGGYKLHTPRPNLHLFSTESFSRFLYILPHLPTLHRFSLGYSPTPPLHAHSPQPQHLPTLAPFNTPGSAQS